MNILIKSFSHQPSAKEDYETNFIHHPSQILSVLVSATCIGNDGRSCPLFHGSLAPMIFGKTTDEGMRCLLLKSNNITWTQTVFRCDDSICFPTLQKEVFEALSKTRYSSKSLKKLQLIVDCEEDKSDVLSFLQTGCEALETLEILTREPILSLTDLASLRPLTKSLKHFECLRQPIPDLEQLQHFNRLQELCFTDTEMNDEQLHPLASLKNLRRLELVRVKDCSGSFLDVVCPSLEKLRVLKIGNCSDLRLVSGLKHLSNSLEELSLINLRKLHGHEEWVEFPFVKKLNVVYVLFDCYQETFALSPDAFPSVDVLELGIEKDPFRTTNDLFHKKILKSCQRESSTPIKRINIHRNLAEAGLKALSMVPVEELNLDCTWYNEHLSSNIPWSEEKIITKTLKKFKWKNYGEQLSSVAFLINCKQLESLELHKFMSKIDLSALSNLPLLKELSFVPPVQEKEKSFVIKDLFRSAVVFPSLQKLELIDEKAISLFEGLENILPNLRILVSSARVDEREKDENLLNSFLHLVRNFPKLEEIRFNGKCISSSRKMFNPMNTRIPRLLKKEKPSLIIYYPETCQYEIELEKAGPRRIAQTDSAAPSNRWATSNTNNNTNATTFSWGASTTFPGWGSTTTNKTPQEQATTTWVWNNHATGGSSWGSSSSSSQQQSTTTSGWWGSTNNNNNSSTATTSTTDQQQTTEKKSVWGE